MPTRKYTDNQLSEAAGLREIGLSYAAIARRLGMSVGAVSWHCLRPVPTARTRAAITDRRASLRSLPAAASGSGGFPRSRMPQSSRWI